MKGEIGHGYRTGLIILEFYKNVKKHQNVKEMI